MISHLTGRAKAWASAEGTSAHLSAAHSLIFRQRLKKTFVSVTDDRETAQELSGLRQGSDMATPGKLLAAPLAPPVLPPVSLTDWGAGSIGICNLNLHLWGGANVLKGLQSDGKSAQEAEEETVPPNSVSRAPQHHSPQVKLNWKEATFVNFNQYSVISYNIDFNFPSDFSVARNFSLPRSPDSKLMLAFCFWIHTVHFFWCMFCDSKIKL